MRILALLLMLGITPCAAQNQFFVNSATGLDTNNGTSTGTAWATIQKCTTSMTLSASGAVCNVVPGNYVAPNTLTGITINTGGGSSSQRVVYRSTVQNGAKVSLAKWWVSTGVNFVSIIGFDLTCPSCSFAINLESGHDRVIQYNYIHDYTTIVGSCPLVGVIKETSAPASSDIIDGNAMRHLGNTTCGGSGYIAIYSDGSGVRITNNIISGLQGGWAIQKQYAGITDCTPGVISNNTIFNNSGGLVLNDEGNACALNHWTINNNIIVNNGVSGTGTPKWGIDYFHMANAPNTLVSNNMVYGNLPANYAIHDVTCTGGTAGCPAVNPKSDPGVTTTFQNFQADTNSAPAVNYSPTNYRPNTGSSAIQGGTTSCASGGLSPCVPSLTFDAATRPVPPSVGAYDITGVTVQPPTGLTATVN